MQQLPPEFGLHFTVPTRTSLPARTPGGQHFKSIRPLPSVSRKSDRCCLSAGGAWSGMTIGDGLVSSAG